MKKSIFIIVFLLPVLVSSVAYSEDWYNFLSAKELTIISKEGNKYFKLHGTSFNPLITEKGTLLFGTGAGFIYEFDNDGLIHSHEENGIFYHVFDSMNKIVALSGTPLHSGGTANIVIFSDDYKKRNVLFSEETSGRTFVSYLKNINLILVNLGGYYYGNDYFVVDIEKEKIIWHKGDCSSLMVPYRNINNGFEFIYAEPDSDSTIYDENGDMVKRFFKIKDIFVYQLLFTDTGNTSHKLETNLIEYFDKTKEFSNIAAYCEDKVFNDIGLTYFGYDSYLMNLLTTGEISLNQFPRLKESHRENGSKVIFYKVD